jgi:eukaryotic-like serine/threonine-protein kinase
LNTGGNRSVDEIFSEALELADEGREQFIRQRCAGDTELERQIVSLLRASRLPDDELAQRFDTARERLWRSVIGEKEEAGEDLSGQRVNAWRLVKQLARGGLATVYLAQREDGAFEQTAAFKVLRRGLDTDDLVARFRAERQMLSSLDHPSIAGILDGGALEDGRPYLVLEYIDGRPITDYCKNRDADTRECASLLLQVLRALHHAHKRLIVHRDIKPSNILVSTDGHVSLLDFGIAKLLDPAAMPGASTLTRTGVSLLTPGCGSPEQHAGQPVTTASDIHQVGQVMYEMLTGERPFDGPRQPPDSGQVLPSQAVRGKPLYNKVRGDLDAIVGKAMHPDPERRYASADEMVADLERYLDGRPVLASPDTLRYRLGKLGKRRPWLLPAIAIAVIAVGVYIATLTQYTQQLQIEQRRAEAAQSFMVDLLRSADPFAPADPERGRHITVVEALDIGVQRLDTDLHDDPELRATLLVSIASVYASLDQHEKSIELREEALSLERVLYGEQSSEVLDSLQALAGLYRAVNDYERAIEYNDKQLAVARRLYPEQHPAVGAAEASAAELEQALGNGAAARMLYEDGIRKMHAAPSEYARQLITALLALAIMQSDAADEDAMASLAEAHRMATELHGADSLTMALVHAQTATVLSIFGDYEASTKEFRSSIDIYESKVGGDHDATLSARNNLGYLYLNTGQLELAELLFADLVERTERKYGSENRGVANAYQNLAGTIGRQNRFAEAIPLHRKAFDIYKSVLPGDHFMQAYPLISIAYAELKLGDHAEAENTARQAHALLEATVPGTYPAGVAQCLVGLALEGQGRAEEGAATIRQSHSILAVSAVYEPYRSACRVPDPGT